MSGRDVSNPSWQSWRDIYIAALFEADKSRLCERIEAAQRAVVMRTRELFRCAEDQQKERKALEAAQCALRALRWIHGGQLSTRSSKKWVHDASPETYAAA